MLRVLFIFGTRPEAIKMAPVIRELADYSDRIQSVVCVTAQHREMLDQVLSFFEIQPDIDLNLMEENQSLSSLTSHAMTRLTEVLLHVKPDLVLVQGDTTTAMVAALASSYQKIPVGHIEAGLRTRNRYSPFPEEINRRLLSVLATYHFAPTETAVHALLAEGVALDRIYLTGNTVVDALFMTLDHPSLTRIDFPFNGEKLILVTAHRRESFGRPLENISAALLELVHRNQDIEIVYPVHMNPKVQGPIHRKLSGYDRIHLIAPLDYERFVYLMNRSYLILTDSGGIQEEAPAIGKPVLVMRDLTERPEAVEAGVVKVVGTEPATIVAETEKLLHDQGEYERMARAMNLYGDGCAAKRIVQVILDRLESDRSPKVTAASERKSNGEMVTRIFTTKVEPFTKRLFDIVLSSIALVVSSPFWVIFALAIKLEDKGPVFHVQERVGRRGKVFKMFKFRSMIINAESKTGAIWAKANDPRVTRVGRFLRATAMDELPQLLNILRGDISFGGPRPERPEFVERFRSKIPNYDLRHSIRPGLTGLAQLYGRYDASPRQKLRYDLLYVKKTSLWLDLKLIFLSFWVTVRGRWESRGRKF